MYDKIAAEANRQLNYDDGKEILAEDVEAYLRYGDMTYIEDHEAELIDTLLDEFL